MAQAELSPFRDYPKKGLRGIMTSPDTKAPGAGEDTRARRAAGTTSTQVGKACETLVACSLMLASRGRLSPFMPLADDDGLDLILLDKLTAKTILVQVKGWTSPDAGDHGIVQFDVRKKTIRGHYGSLLLAVRVDLKEVRITQSWVMPMAAVPDLASDKRDIFAIRASTKPHGLMLEHIPWLEPVFVCRGIE